MYNFWSLCPRNPTYPNCVSCNHAIHSENAGLVTSSHFLHFARVFTFSISTQLSHASCYDLDFFYRLMAPSVASVDQESLAGQYVKKLPPSALARLKAAGVYLSQGYPYIPATI